MVEIIKTTMVLVDTCIWLDYLNKNQSKETDILDLLLQENKVYIADIIKAEIISGSKNNKEYNELCILFLDFPKLEPDNQLWDKISYARFNLKRQGLSIAIPDLMIAVLAEQYSVPILTNDKHFLQIQKVLDFKLIPFRFQNEIKIPKAIY